MNIHTCYREAALLKKTYIHTYKLQRGYINKHFKQPYTQYTHTHSQKHIQINNIYAEIESFNINILVDIYRKKG